MSKILDSLGQEIKVGDILCHSQVNRSSLTIKKCVVREITPKGSVRVVNFEEKNLGYWDTPSGNWESGAKYIIYDKEWQEVKSTIQNTSNSVVVTQQQFPLNNKKMQLLRELSNELLQGL